MTDGTTPMRAVVIDDEQQLAEQWAHELGRGAESAGIDASVTPLFGENLATAIRSLAERQRALSRDLEWEEESPFGDCDVLVVDADLRYVEDALLATGQGVIYLARCFADIGAIVLLNAYGQNSFDLTLLGRPTAFAEALVGSRQIGAESLWRSAKPGEFRPWSWPLLQHAARAQRNRVDALVHQMDRSIIEVLELDTFEIEAMERSIASFLLDERGKRRTLADLTVWDFVTESRYGLASKDGEALSAERAQHVAVARRVGAARLGHWINRVVAPTQDLLADAPHLAEQFPSSLDGDASADRLNATARLELAHDSAPHRMCEALGFESSGPMTEHAFWPSVWADRPLWWGRRLRRSALPEVERPWEAERTELRFCEDESGFREEAAAQSFACDLATPFRIRSISSDMHEGVIYRPKENIVAVDETP